MPAVASPSVNIRQQLTGRSHFPPALKWHAHAGAVAVAKLKIGDYYSDGNQWWFHFGEKGGKVHQVPARDDLQKQMKAYIEATKLAGLSDKAPLFRSAMKRKRALTDRPISDRQRGVALIVHGMWMRMLRSL